MTITFLFEITLEEPLLHIALIHTRVLANLDNAGFIKLSVQLQDMLTSGVIVPEVNAPPPAPLAQWQEVSLTVTGSPHSRNVER
jgi:hypothetical protein